MVLLEAAACTPVSVSIVKHDPGHAGLTQDAFGDREAFTPRDSTGSAAGRADHVGEAAIDAPAFSNEQRGERAVFLSTDLASRRQVRFAQLTILMSCAIFIAAAPFAKMPLKHVAAFTPMYVSALVICDLITVVLLFGQFQFLRSWALLVLANGYLFTASMTLSYVFMFPGLFSSTGLLGAGAQSTSAMYLLWHAGFPLAIIGYVLFKDSGSETPRRTDPEPANGYMAIPCSIAGAISFVIGCTLFATAGHGYIPTFILGDRTTDLGRFVLMSDWLLSFLALVSLWWRRPHTTIDLWLTVVMCAWLFDLALSAILNTGRYDLGWYVGRIYGLLAASFLLAVLVIESGRHYARLFRMSERLTTANQLLERLSLLDGLTNLANRRYFDSYLDRQISVARRHKRPLALVLYDVDAFKGYNDHYGHQAGDECLKRVAAALRSCCQRPADMVARYGGEEFAMILPDTELTGATQVAEAARVAVTQLGISHEHSPATAYISISGGVAVLLQNMGFSAHQLVAAADQTLYQAKSQGRNQIVFARAVPLSARV